jgi:hypothetical protein
MFILKLALIMCIFKKEINIDINLNNKYYSDESTNFLTVS